MLVIQGLVWRGLVVDVFGCAAKVEAAVDEVPTLLSRPIEAAQPRDKSAFIRTGIATVGDALARRCITLSAHARVPTTGPPL